MKVYTIESGNVTEGVEILTLELKNGIKIPVVKIGEEGRGRRLTSIPVQLSRASQMAWESGQDVRLHFAKVGQTKTGNPKLIECAADEGAEFIGVFFTQIGFRGSNDHTGDRIDIADIEKGFKVFPGQILAEGVIAQGDAGRMGGGKQIVAVLSKGTVFRTAYYGRLYGAPRAHYYMHDGVNLNAFTWEEREASDLF